MKALGEKLAAHTSRADDTIVLIAPFIKLSALQRVLSDSSAPSVRVVTRWRLTEIANGVSDIGIYPYIRELGGELLLKWNLHAKYYRSDTDVLIGSANLTSTALGWVSPSNLELLVCAPADEFIDFESEVFAESITVTDAIYAAFEDAVANWGDLRPQPQAQIDASIFDSNFLIETWIPKVRQPRLLYRYYSHPLDDVFTESQVEALNHDLQILNLPRGLDEQRFTSAVRATLQTIPLFIELDHFLRAPKRFGEVRTYLINTYGLDRDDSTSAWQTIIRWLKYFFPDTYSYSRPRHSEVIQRLD